MTLPAYEDIAKPTPAEMQWAMCRCGRPMPENERLTYGAHETCWVGEASGVVDDRCVSFETLEHYRHLTKNPRASVNAEGTDTNHRS